MEVEFKSVFITWIRDRPQNGVTNGFVTVGASIVVGVGMQHLQHLQHLQQRKKEQVYNMWM